MSEWIETVSNYGALGVLTILFFLFAIGKIISSKTLHDIKKSYEKTIERLCSSFEKQIESLKDLIEILRKENGRK